MENIHHYFPWLTQEQLITLEKLKPIYQHWNQKINVISRKDMDNFYIRHVLHSLSIAAICRFNAGTRILDVGTGGGFPGIPLAIMFPQCRFFLIDSIQKKIKVVHEVVHELQLSNVTPIRERAENIQGKYDFVISRAVTALPGFMQWVHDKIAPENNNTCKNGVLYLKGGDLTDELKPLHHAHKVHDLSRIFQEEFFETKKLVHIYNK